MKTYIIGRAEIVGPGNYHFELIEQDQAREWLREHPASIRYLLEDARHCVSEILAAPEAGKGGGGTPVLAPGDVALVIRENRAINAEALCEEGQADADAQPCEYGLLTAL
jgi:hypothetical protein